MEHFVRGLAVVGIGLLTLINAKAVDIGGMPPSEKGYVAEVYYEAYTRDVVQEIAYSSETFENEQEENRIVARLKYFPDRNWAVSLDVGAADSKHSEGYVPMVGIGSHVVVFEADNGTYMSLFGKATHVSEIKYKREFSAPGQNYYFTYIDYFQGERTETYWEYGLGAQFGRSWMTQQKNLVTLYSGLLASMIASDGKAKDWYYGAAVGRFTGNVYEDGDYTEDNSVDFEEDNPVSLFAGADLTFPRSDFGIRLEARLLDQSSFTLALTKGFGAGLAKSAPARSERKATSSPKGRLMEENQVRQRLPMSLEERLVEMKSLHTQGLLTDAEYEQVRQSIIRKAIE